MRICFLLLEIVYTHQASLFISFAVFGMTMFDESYYC